MQNLLQSLNSTTGRKYVMALSGLALFGFLLTHVSANLLLLAPDQGRAFNLYAHGLAELGPLLYVAELGLLGLLALHVFTAARLQIGKRLARTQRYAVSARAGAPSRVTVASLSMAYTGLLLLAFLVLHIKGFKFGTEYTVTYDGVPVRDLKRLVVETYENPAWVGGYMAMMVVLGLHLRHGLWSAAQSMGLNHPKWQPLLEKAGLAAAVLMALGFFVIPIAIFLGVGQ